jgi:hypothetical protein
LFDGTENLLLLIAVLMPGTLIVVVVAHLLLPFVTVIIVRIVD